MPGRWLLAIARLVFNESVVTRVFEPTVADFRADVLNAGPDRTAMCVAHWRGYWALCSVLTISAFVFWVSDRRNDMTVRTSVRLVAAMIVLGLATGYVVARLQPDKYRSTAVIQVVPPRVPEGVAMAPQSREALRDRLRNTESVILSRTRLERMITEFNLYEVERRSGIMEDVVSQMRRQIRFEPRSRGDVFAVSYTGSNPTTVQRVTEKLASYFIDESLKDSARADKGTRTLLDARIEDTSARLETLDLELARSGKPPSISKRLELEVVQESYKSLLRQREDMLMRVEIERRSIGEEFRLLEAAQVPGRPIGASSAQLAAIGGGAGLLAAFAIMLIDSLRRAAIRRRRSVANVSA